MKIDTDTRDRLDVSVAEVRAGSHGDHVARELVPQHTAGRHDRRLARQVQIRTANSRRPNAQYQIVRARHWIRQLGDGERLPWRSDDGGTHDAEPSYDLDAAASPMRNARRVRSSHCVIGRVA